MMEALPETDLLAHNLSMVIGTSETASTSLADAHRLWRGVGVRDRDLSAIGK